MSMTEILYEAVDVVPGARFAGVVATDGLSVEMVAADDELPLELATIEIELATLASSAAQISTRLGAGLSRDFIVEADELILLGSFIASGYYAVLGLSSEGNLGRARFAVRQMVNRMQDEL